MMMASILIMKMHSYSWTKALQGENDMTHIESILIEFLELSVISVHIKLACVAC